MYGELQRLAVDQMKREKFSVTLQLTALINEAFLRLFGSTASSAFNHRSHFLGIASLLMRQILVDYARERQAQKRGRGLQVSLEDVAAEPGHAPADLLTMEGALERLAHDEPRLVRLIEMRFFGGMTVEETAATLGESAHVVRHHPRYAMACLRRDLETTSRLNDNSANFPLPLRIL